VYRSNPFIVARLLCCLFVDLIWRNLLYIPVERETLFRVSLGRIDCGPTLAIQAKVPAVIAGTLELR